MRTIHFSPEYAMSVQGSPWALILYQREFADDQGNCDWYADFGQLHETMLEKGRFDCMFLLKTAWAMGKCYDDDLPSFDDWARNLDCSMVADAPWLKEVFEAIFAEIFRKQENGKKASK